MSKENNPIDDIFKDAFENWEDMPQNDVWDEIIDDLDATDVDEVFKSNLADEEYIPSEKVWEGVKGHLPLNLWLKRRLSKLSYVAGVLVVGMLLTIYFTTSDTENPVPVEEEQNFNIEIAIKEAPMEEEALVVEESPVEKGMATDNTIDKKMNSVELNKEDEIVFDIDEEKIREILRPIEPLSIDSSVARVNGANNTSENESTDSDAILPDNLENILPDLNEEILENEE